MNKRTAEIIMICKGQHEYGQGLGYKQAIAAFLSDHCNCPPEFYNDGVIVNRAILDAALDYLDNINAHNPSAFIRNIFDAYHLHNNPLVDAKYHADWYDAICDALSNADVRSDSGEYINGFTEENIQVVRRAVPTNGVMA